VQIYAHSRGSTGPGDTSEDRSKRLAAPLLLFELLLRMERFEIEGLTSVNPLLIVRDSKRTFVDFLQYLFRLFFKHKSQNFLRHRIIPHRSE
jgi:hypothetical protein